MGLAAFFKRKMGHRRAKEAADQIWQQLLRGRTLEIPATLSTDDVTTQSILVLREEHPEVIATMLQSRSIVLTLSKAGGGIGNVSSEAYQQLVKGDYFPDSRSSSEIYLAQHAAFMLRNGIDPDEAVEKAVREDRERHAIEVSNIPTEQPTPVASDDRTSPPAE